MQPVCVYLRIVKNRPSAELLNGGEGRDLSDDFKILIELDENICILIWVSACWVIMVLVEQHNGSLCVSKTGTDSEIVIYSKKKKITNG